MSFGMDVIIVMIKNSLGWNLYQLTNCKMDRILVHVFYMKKENVFPSLCLFPLFLEIWIQSIFVSIGIFFRLCR